MDPVSISQNLALDVSSLSFALPVTHCYNPLLYAKESAVRYLSLYSSSPKETVFLGMNPGPWGMAQTGVPFGDVVMVRDWMRIQEKVGRPANEHPKRPIQGFECPRREVSGSRFWGWARERFETPEAFFERFFVWNYCPLSFMTESGRNHTPDKLPASEREALYAACDRALVRLVDFLEPQWVIGIGKFAERRAREALKDKPPIVGSILHPSPASPAANRGWALAAEKALLELGIAL